MSTAVPKSGSVFKLGQPSQILFSQAELDMLDNQRFAWTQKKKSLRWISIYMVVRKFLLRLSQVEVAAPLTHYNSEPTSGSGVLSTFPALINNSEESDGEDSFFKRHWASLVELPFWTRWGVGRTGQTAEARN